MKTKLGILMLGSLSSMFEIPVNDYVKRDLDWLQFEEDFDIISEFEGLVA